MPNKLPASYYDGKSERRRNKPKSSVPYQHMTRQWSWWLAGWNDYDRELEAKPHG